MHFLTPLKFASVHKKCASEGDAKQDTVELNTL